jgi:hypothetical protein
MRKRCLKHNNSGQVIVITALMVALVLLSTAIFIIETEKDVPTDTANPNSGFSVYQQALRNTLISALANVTNGGAPSVLAADLNELKSAIASDSYQSMLQINFTSLTEVPYQNGICISWGSHGQGISSACVTVEMESTEATSESISAYLVNVTSEINLSGSYTQLDNNLTQVNLTINVQNENLPALAQNLSFYIKNTTGVWTEVDTFSGNDFGNGTYTVTFNAQTDTSVFPLQVSAVCEDQLGIAVAGNVTCTELG